MKSKEYDNEILNLQHELAEYDQVENRIQKHLDSVTQISLQNIRNSRKGEETLNHDVLSYLVSCSLHVKIPWLCNDITITLQH